MAVVTAGWLEEGPGSSQSQDLGNLPHLLCGALAHPTPSPKVHLRGHHVEGGARPVH